MIILPTKVPNIVHYLSFFLKAINTGINIRSVSRKEKQSCRFNNINCGLTQKYYMYLPETVANIMSVFPFFVIFSISSGLLVSNFDRSILGGVRFHSGSSSSSNGSSCSCHTQKLNSLTGTFITVSVNR